MSSNATSRPPEPPPVRSGLGKPPPLRSGLAAGCSRLPHFVGEASLGLFVGEASL